MPDGAHESQTRCPSTGMMGNRYACIVDWCFGIKKDAKDTDAIKILNEFEKKVIRELMGCKI